MANGKLLGQILSWKRAVHDFSYWHNLAGSQNDDNTYLWTSWWGGRFEWTPLEAVLRLDNTKREEDLKDPRVRLLPWAKEKESSMWDGSISTFFYTNFNALFQHKKFNDVFLKMGLFSACFGKSRDIEPKVLEGPRIVKSEKAIDRNVRNEIEPVWAKRDQLTINLTGVP